MVTLKVCRVSIPQDSPRCTAGEGKGKINMMERILDCYSEGGRENICNPAGTGSETHRLLATIFDNKHGLFKLNVCRVPLPTLVAQASWRNCAAPGRGLFVE